MNKKLFLIFSILLILTTILLLISKPKLLDNISFGKTVYDRNGTLLRLTLADDEQYRIFAPLEEISENFIKATLIYEDRFFWFHIGINPIAILKAGFDTYIKHKKRRGASTITMQLARLKLNIDSRTLKGKIIQIYEAIKLEFFYSKKEILEAYLNLAPYGGNIQGVKAASLIYFNKNSDQLTLSQALTLSVIPQNPSKRTPNLIEPNSLFEERVKLAKRWLKKYPKTKEQELGLNSKLPMKKNLPFLAPHFVNMILENEKGSIKTTLDIKLQKQIEKIVKRYIKRNNSKGIFNTSVMLIDYTSMETLAMIGSADFFNKNIQGQVNGTLAKRSPGSALKPFIYALAIEEGLIHPTTLLKDSPMRFGGFNPENFDKKFQGPISATDALIYSRNIPAVDLTFRLPKNKFYDFLKQSMISYLQNPDFYGLALVLGGLEVTMNELIRLYAAIGNLGILHPIKYKLNNNNDKGKKILTRESAYLILQMLKQNPAPDQTFNSSWIRNPLSISWKTGTSYGYRDAWAIGITGQFVIAVWVGNFDGKGNPSFVGRKAAAPLFFQIIDSLKKDIEIPEQPLDLNITKTKVCSVSGMLPTTYCKHSKDTFFIPGISPIKRCDIHRPVYISKKNGLRACTNDPEKNLTRIYEFWPSDLIKLFNKAGLARNIAPPFAPECHKISNQVTGPKITSPQENLTYNIRANKKNPQRIPFTAISDGQITSLHWFVDEEPVGNISPGETLFWTPKPGEFNIRVVDNNGYSDIQKIKIKIIK